MTDGFMTGFNLRRWLEDALEAKSAEVVGAGVSVDGWADVDIELEGFRYNVKIAPLLRQSSSEK